MTDPRTILDFWFSERAKPLWFERDRAFDEEIRARFGDDVHAAQGGAFENWRQSPDGCLALLILLDQMARNIHRGEARAFLGDARAREIADGAIRRGFDLGMPFTKRSFLYLPFEHGEDMANQNRAVDLFTRLRAEVTPDQQAEADVQLDYAHRHRDCIRRFGRFPGRNAALGRPSTEDEIAFLGNPKNSF